MKKNVLKKFAAATLAAATVMSSMSVMAFADDTKAGTTEEKGSVTITKYMGDTGAGDTLSPEDYTGDKPTGEGYTLLQGVEFAYVEVGERVQVDIGEGKSSQTEIQYKVTNNDFLQAIGIKEGVGNYTQTQLNNAIKAEKNKTITFVKNNAKKANKKPTADTSGEVKFEGLSLHKLYVFAETDATKAALASNADNKVTVTKVSVPFLVSLPFTGKDGTTVTDLKVYPKNSTGEDTIDKKIVEGTDKKVSTTANIGDKINYKVTYSIPVGENGLESLVVTDTMSKGLTFVKDVKVENGTTIVAPENYNVASPTNTDGITTTTVTFTENYCKTLDPNTTQEFTITYTATLNDKAVLGKKGNTNTVFVEYTNKDDIKRKTDEKTTTVFTYGIDLQKQFEGTTIIKLDGVKFTLTDESGNAIKVEKKSPNTFYTPGGDSNEVTTDDNGKIYIKGLKPGTYKLKETKTKEGYVLLKAPVVIEIKDDNATGEAKAFVGTKEVTMTADSGSDTAKVPLTVVNSKGFDLPATGGRGIALFTIAGIAIVAAAGSLLFMRKRSK